MIVPAEGGALPNDSMPKQRNGTTTTTTTANECALPPPASVLQLHHHSPLNVLVTGGCGFIGSNFINHIWRRWPAARIWCVDKLILDSDCTNVAPEVRNGEGGRYRCVLADIRNRAVMARVLDENKVGDLPERVENAKIKK